MATADRASDLGVKDSPLAQTLQDDPNSFEFFQAVMLLHRLGHGRPVGRFANPDDEAIRFRVNNGLAFPGSQIQSLQWPEDEVPEMSVNFMGLTGPMGVLPYCYTELILERQREKDRSLAEFLDIFNHRLLSFFYRAWEKYRFPVTYSLGEEDVFSRHLLDLIGMGTTGLQDRQTIPDHALLHYVGLLGMHSRSAVALEQIVSDYFEVPAEVEQFAGAWQRLDVSSCSRMNEGESYSEQLGAGVVVGDEIWDQHSRVRIKLGPLSLEQYRDFLPGGTALEPLRDLTRFFSNNEFDFEVQLILKRDEVPECEVGESEAEGAQLGWVTWLKTMPLGRDPGDTILPL